LPAKLRVPLQGGPTDGVAVTQEEFEVARARYYEMVGWDNRGMPTPAKLYELGLGWLADDLYG
jgi:aldehyde:ferredoxin oxidoreductase